MSMTQAGTGGTFGPHSHHAPDLIEPVVGFRLFGYREQRGRVFTRHLLTGHFIAQPWYPGWNVAECQWHAYLTKQPIARRDSRCPKEHAAPHQLCSCGFYANYDLNPHPSKSFIAGVIEAKGRVMAHERGMRVEMARPLALSTMAHWSQEQRRALVKLARNYGVALVPHEELPAFAAEHGTVLPASLRATEDVAA